MASELTALLDSLACGLLEVRRRLCSPGSLLVSEHVDAIGHVKVAYAAIVNLRRIFRRVEQRDIEHDAPPPSNLIPFRDRARSTYLDGSASATLSGAGMMSVACSLNHGPTAAEWRAVHEEIKNTDQMWRSLAFDGLQSDGRGGLIEYRRCPHCSSTLGRRISHKDAIELCRMSAEVHARSLEALTNIPSMPQRRRVARK